VRVNGSEKPKAGRVPAVKKEVLVRVHVVLMSALAIVLSASAVEADSLNCRLVGSCGIPGVPLTVAVAGSHAYVATLDSGLYVVNVGFPNHPAVVGSCRVPGMPVMPAVYWNHVYLTSLDSGLYVINVTDPQSPQVVGCFRSSADGDIQAVAVAGSYAYVTYGDSGLRVLDISNPQSPAQVSYLRTDGPAGDIKVSGSCAYVTEYDWGG